MVLTLFITGDNIATPSPPGSADYQTEADRVNDVKASLASAPFSVPVSALSVPVPGGSVKYRTELELSVTFTGSANASAFVQNGSFATAAVRVAVTSACPGALNGAVAVGALSAAGNGSSSVVTVPVAVTAAPNSLSRSISACLGQVNRLAVVPVRRQRRSLAAAAALPPPNASRIAAALAAALPWPLAAATASAPESGVVYDVLIQAGSFAEAEALVSAFSAESVSVDLPPILQMSARRRRCCSYSLCISEEVCCICTIECSSSC